MIAVDYLTYKVKKSQYIPAKKEDGDYIQGFSEYSLVLFAPRGFCKKNKILEDSTSIVIK